MSAEKTSLLASVSAQAAKIEEAKENAKTAILSMSATYQENLDLRKEVNELRVLVAQKESTIKLLELTIAMERENVRVANDGRLQAEVDRAAYETLINNARRILNEFTAPIEPHRIRHIGKFDFGKIGSQEDGEKD